MSPEHAARWLELAVEVAREAGEARADTLPRFSGRLVTSPAWRPSRPRAGEDVVRLDPGMAFGTGQHPTTLMCLRALEETVQPGAHALDLGAGSRAPALAGR